MQTILPQENKVRTWPSLAARALGALALFLVAFAIYGSTLSYEMICDDFASIIDNKSIHHLFPLFGSQGEYGPLKPQPATPLTARPLVSLTFAINYYFSALNPVSYRLAHIVAHALVALILWAIVSQTLRQPKFEGRYLGNRQVLGFLSALIWMIHPMHTETVVYLTQRTELQMGFFYAITLFVSIRFWESTALPAKWFWCIAAVACSVCGMLSKEMMASVPAMVFFYEWTFVGGSLWCMFKRSRLLYLGLTLSWVPIIAIYVWGKGTPVAGFHNTISAHDFWLTQSNSFFVYWRLLLAPWPLSFHYHVDIQSQLAAAWPSVLALGLYLGVCAYFVWRRTSIGFAMLWFFAVLSPTLIVPLPHEELSERRMYVTIMAVVPLLVVIGFERARWLAGMLSRAIRNGDAVGSGRTSHAISKWIGVTLISGVAIAYFLICILTLPRLQYRSEVWQHVLKHQPHNTFALCAQGVEDCNKGNFREGLDKIQTAYDSDPDYAFFNITLAQTLEAMQENERMLTLCRRMYARLPDQSSWVYSLAVSLEKNGMAAEAIDKYRETIELAPKSWEAHSALATLLAENNKLDESIKHFEIATELHPDFVNCMNLMSVYVNMGQEQKALSVGKQLLEAARKEKSEQEVEQIQGILQNMERSIKEK
jgi:protein O-mannosyl-transferase